MNAGSKRFRGLLVITVLAVAVLWLALVALRGSLARRAAPAPAPAAQPAVTIPISKLPGPPRPRAPMRFALCATNAQVMTGMDDSANERWCDTAEHDYSPEFVASFSYEGRGARRPEVLVQVEPRADTLRGRLEAHRLKPNFTYQIKLRGIFADRRSFEAIGRMGRWRLPGRGTNYTDEDYESFPAKEAVEAYILFDYFVTDRNGNAIREFALDSSLHVLWNASRQAGAPEHGDLLRAIVLADDPAVYAVPSPAPTAEWLWAERERVRYTSVDQRITLPPGEYRAELVLTEESFHSSSPRGGFWATVYRCPVAFTVDPAAPGAK